MHRFTKFALVTAVVASAVFAQAAELAVLRNGFEIRHEQREAIGSTTRLYLNADRSGGYVDIPTAEIARYEHDDSVRAPEPSASSQVARGTNATAVDVHAAVDAASKAHAIDPDLIASVISAESSFNHRAISPKGAQGLMQLMPETAAKLGVTNSFDPNANVDGGTRYLRELLLKYNDDLIKALAAYNAGPKRVDQYRGVPPYHETQKYVARIIKDFNRKKLAPKKNSASQPRKNAAPAKAVSTAANHEAFNSGQ